MEPLDRGALGSEPLKERSAKHEWGPALWAFLHTITVIDSSDPETVRRMSRDASKCLAALADAIPCCKCAEFYRARPAPEGPPIDRMALFRWGWALHNEVNAKLGRAQMTLDEAIERWTVGYP
jgi:hypothetical protein